MPIVINGSGTVTGLSVGGLPDGSVDRDTLANNAKGSILQVVQATELGVQSSTSTSWADISGITVNITPSSTSSKVLVQTDLSLSCTGRYGFVKLVRDSTDLGLGNADGSRTRCTFTIGSNNSASNDALTIKHNSFSWLDSPSTTSQVTYKAQWIVAYGSYTMYLNRFWESTNEDHAYNSRPSSTITVMEVAG